MILAVWLAPNAAAQNLCSTTDSSKVACTVANVFGPNGLTSSGGTGALAVTPNTGTSFGDSFLANLSALNTSIGSQLGQLPLVSPASGISFSFEKSLGIFVPVEYNFGPILSERAGTIGRHRILVGFSYQNFNFETLDGMRLDSFPAVYTQLQPLGCSPTGNSTGNCAFIRDVIVTQNNIDLRVNQFTTFMSFGLTSRLDVSVAVPTVNVRMSVTSLATIKNNGSDNTTQFPASGTNQPCSPNPCFNRTFFNAAGATGIGDVIVRVKYNLWAGERAGLAAGGDVRFPSGDELNYLGAGAYGIKPFAAFSFSPVGRFSTHANLGYQWNSSSFLAGNITPSQSNGTVAPTKSTLPGQLTYTAGGEIGIVKSLSAAFDFLGQHGFNAPRIQASMFQELPACTLSAPRTVCNSFASTGATDPDFQQVKGSYTTSDAAVGLRFRPFGHFLITGNVIIRIDDAGLRSRFIPLVGITYSH